VIPASCFYISSALDNVRRMVATCRDNCRQVIAETAPRPIRSVGVVGAGIMGSEIALEHARLSIPVVLMDNSPAALQRAEERLAQKGAVVEQAHARSLKFTQNENDLRECDLVIESIIEKRSAKQSFYAALQPHLAGNAVLATNTSTIPISQLSSGLPDPGRFGGLHFCHPVCHRPLVEVIAGPVTNRETTSTLVAHAIRLGKLPLVVSDTPGFVVNRLLLTYLNEALAAVIAGMPIDDIDSAMVKFGMPLGPLALLDEIGLDTALQSGVVLADVFGDRAAGSVLLVRLVKAKQLGKKTGAGFYSYPAKSPNPSVGEVCSQISNTDNRLQYAEAGTAAIAGQFLSPMVAEARRMIAEKLVSSDTIDLAVIFGLGFPVWRGGLLYGATTQ
jgi:3-hydroxyacyl-CoA dehydrogenase